MSVTELNHVCSPPAEQHLVHELLTPDEKPVDLDFLTPEERDVILAVLARDENLKRKEQERIEQLKKEIRDLRAQEFSRISFDVSRLCGRCLQEFSWLFNKGQVCSKCRLRVCKKCRQLLNNKTWMCLVCLRILELETQTGSWFYTDYPQNKKNMSSCQIISAIDLLRSSLSNLESSDANEGENTNGVKVKEEEEPETIPPITMQLTGKDYLPRDESRQISTTDLRYQRNLMREIMIAKAGDHFKSTSDINLATIDSDEDEDDQFDGGNPPKKKKRITNLTTSFSNSMESLRSIYSGAGEVHYGKVIVSGEVELNCLYDDRDECLYLNVIRCRELGIVNFKKRNSNPYVKCYLLPEKNRRSKRKSHVVKNTLNPVFNVTFEYKISSSTLSQHSLCLMVWHSDKLGRNDFLGEVIIPLNEVTIRNLSTNQWLPFKPRSSVHPSSLSYYGDFDLCLKFVSGGSLKMKDMSGRGELQVLVKRARNLSTDKSSKLNGSFCRALLLHGNMKTFRQKSSIVQAKNHNPSWNHTFVFTDLTRNDLLESSLELTFWDRDKGSNDFLGGVRLNTGAGFAIGKKAEFMDGKGEEVFLWQSMLDRPDIWIEGTLMLRANMISRK